MDIVGMRITGIDKNYYLRQLELFEQAMIDKGRATRVEFGKQDMRGVPSICLFNDGCVTQQKHFNSKDELLGYVVGYNEALDNFFKGNK